ncbi:protein of unknown function [Candidatus Nitrospira inopinata]|jgi:hypothetical protein|uniref:Uncharacterized protein n=1 Tax=Candidatus Nitrospira inopinata TaxID=1715989 RepID=A0A0S4KT30_9BACT|nr:protein of unknown function [Candidatus Nitrospira inopinata]
MPCDLFMRLVLEPLENSWLWEGSSNGVCQGPLRVGFRFRDPAPKIGTSSLALFTSGFGSEDDKGAQRTGTTTTMAARYHVCLVSSPIREPWRIGYGMRGKDGSAIGGYMKKWRGEVYYTSYTTETLALAILIKWAQLRPSSHFSPHCGTRVPTSISLRHLDDERLLTRQTIAMS